jgi:hypothetical protein
MDFISLAMDLSPARLLDEMLGEDESTIAAHATSVVSNSTTNYQQEQYSTGTTLPTASSMNDTLTTRPYISKSAEAELYLLATNFLLYVGTFVSVVVHMYMPTGYCQFFSRS